MKNLRDYTKLKNMTAIKTQARKDFLEIVTRALIKEFGDDAVKQVEVSEYAVVLGTAKDSAGFPVDVISTVKPCIKEWEDRKTNQREYTKYDIEEAAENWQIKLREKETKKKEKDKAKADKIARDKAAREKEKGEAETEKK